MNKVLAPRGPDSAALWFDDQIVLGHRRLSIIDLTDQANQPFESADGRYILVFNGEIYNYKELRSLLVDIGVPMRTNSDTEVILELFIQFGPECLNKLRGMFAFAIWDGVLSKLFLARDPYGIKPLYYINNQGTFFFASQYRALVAAGATLHKVDYRGLLSFLKFGSVLEPWTLDGGIYSLKAGHYMVVQCTPFLERIVCWNDIRQKFLDPKLKKIPTAELQSIVRDAVTDSVKSHLCSDVPVGIFLSGGIDSAVIAGISSQYVSNLTGFTIVFDEFEGTQQDELPYAKLIAEHYQIKHVVRKVTRKEFEMDMPQILLDMDLPSVDGINTWYASKAAKENGCKVILSGVGGDELFCGYSNFKYLPLLSRLGVLVGKSRGLLVELVVTAVAFFAKNPKIKRIPLSWGSLGELYLLSRQLFSGEEMAHLVRKKDYIDALNAVNEQLELVLNPSATNDISCIASLESSLYLKNQLLRDSDWAGMAHSVEIRTPFVDSWLLHAIAQYVPNFRDGRGKLMLARSPLKPLPPIIYKKKKTGFGTPIALWQNASGIFNSNEYAFAKGNITKKWALFLAKRFE